MSLLPLSALFLLIVHTYRADAITCYQCNSKYDPRCGDPFDPYSIASIDCAMKPPLDHLTPNYANATLCRKTIQKIYGKITVVRECGYITDKERDDGACVKRSGTHDVFAFYCSCSKGLCNSSALHWPSHLVIVMSVLSLFLVNLFGTAAKTVHWSL